MPSVAKKGMSFRLIFNKGDRTSHWYLLLAGEVQLFLPGYYPGSESLPLCSLSAGSLFGELDIDRHCCSAVVTRQAEFVRISQRHFVNLYNVSFTKVTFFHLSQRMV
ncbi:unnamed protein product [Haemonchus placei]|uniref:Cyclic nucleotide-binding domain-containing protein n=1 Tax=Haemonchus placei TaxID=6290 RepID=A0A0N4WMI1_HAEPC|nr:unnamed protein product [Haemonchus placei]